MATGKMWLVATISVDLGKLDQTTLPHGKELSELPTELSRAISAVLPSEVGELEEVFLLTQEERDRVVDALEEHAVHYHEYAVEIRGEPCFEENCTRHSEHSNCVVISLHDRRNRNQTAVDGPPAGD